MEITMIKVVHIKLVPYAEYIGRETQDRPGSPLANPFKMRHENERDDVVAAYKAWLLDKLKTGDLPVRAELNRLYKLAKTGELLLGCYCAPKACHGDIIRQLLLNPPLRR